MLYRPASVSSLMFCAHLKGKVVASNYFSMASPTVVFVSVVQRGLSVEHLLCTV